MHPTSIERLNLFGPYTARFSELKAARLAIKAKDYEKAGSMLDGKLKQYLGDVGGAEELSYALKIVINIVYGLTAARFENPFRDIRNVDNIVAKRGALFMIDLMEAVMDRDFQVVHIKTDSIKIPNPTQEIIEFVTDFGKQFGYEFEHEATYEKFCLVNDAVYVAREGDKWTAVGSQFQHPYVYKTLFTGEELVFDDFCEARSVTKGAIYLDMNHDPDDSSGLIHIGRTGSFVPVVHGGGTLWRIADGKEYAVSGTKGYEWIGRDVALSLQAEGRLEIDMSYFEHLKDQAIAAINKYGSFEEFVER
jgi:hypothetical protein